MSIRDTFVKPERILVLMFTLIKGAVLILYTSKRKLRGIENVLNTFDTHIKPRAF